MLSNGYNDTTLKMNFTVGVLELLLYIHNVLSMYSTLKIIMGPRATWVWILPTGRRRSVRCLVKSGEKCYPGHMCQHLYTTIHSSRHWHPSFLPMRKQLYFQTPIIWHKRFDGMNQILTFSGISRSHLHSIPQDLRSCHIRQQQGVFNERQLFIVLSGMWEYPWWAWNIFKQRHARGPQH